MQPMLKGTSRGDNTSLGGQLEARRVLREEYLLEEYMLALLSLPRNLLITTTSNKIVTWTGTWTQFV